jgi:hypothetical protein
VSASPPSKKTFKRAKKALIRENTVPTWNSVGKKRKENIFSHYDQTSAKSFQLSKFFRNQYFDEVRKVREKNLEYKRLGKKDCSLCSDTTIRRANNKKKCSEKTEIKSEVKKEFKKIKKEIKKQHKNLKNKNNKKKDNKDKIPLCDIRATFETQSAVFQRMTTAVATRFAASAGFTTSMASTMENAVACMIALSDVKTSLGAASVIFMFAKTMYNGSIAEMISKRIHSILTIRYETQSGSEKPIEESPEWLEDLKGFARNWTIAASCKNVDRILGVLSLCVSLGLCQAADIVPTVGGLELFTLPRLKEKPTVFQLVDVALDLAVHFIEGGYLCFKTGSLKPLIDGDPEYTAFTKNYQTCVQCSSLHANGNLSVVMMDENSYDKLLQTTIEAAENLKRRNSDRTMAGILTRQLEKLLLWQADFRTTSSGGGSRVAPYTLGLYGTSAVGKSTLCPILIAFILKSNGFDSSDNMTLVLNEKDAFWSGMKSYINAIILDDMGNTNANFVQTPPTELVLAVNNNVKNTANMADLAQKGKVEIKPKVFIITKNVKDGGASIYSNNPLSITRRENVTITVTVREIVSTNGMLDPEKIEKLYPDGTPMIPDLWEFKVETSYQNLTACGIDNGIGWKAVEFQGQPMEKVRLYTLLAYLKHASKKHYANQERVVNASKNIGENMILCKDCGMPFEDVNVLTDCPHCEWLRTEKNPYAMLEVQSGSSISGFPLFENLTKEMVVGAAKAVYKSGYLPWNMGRHLAGRLNAHLHGTWRKPGVVDRLGLDKKNIKKSVHLVENITTDILIDNLRELENSPWTTWTNWIPSYVLDKPKYMDKIIKHTARTDSEFYNKLGIWSYDTAFPFFILMLAVYFVPFLFGPMAIFLTIGAFIAHATRQSISYRLLLEASKKRIRDKVISDHKHVPKLMASVRDNYASYIIGASAAIGILYVAIKSVRSIRALKSQGNIAPTTVKEVEDRDSEVNKWVPVEIPAYRAPDKSSNVTFEQLRENVKANLVHMEFIIGNNKHFCDAFFPGSNVVLIPNHMWNPVVEAQMTSIKVKFTKRTKRNLGSQWMSIISRAHSVRIPSTDLSLVYVPNAGDWLNLSEYLPLDGIPNSPARMYYRNADGDASEYKLSAVRAAEIDAQGAGTYKGATYSLPIDTFKGMCMATVLSDNARPQILGFHLAGATGTNRGGLGILTQAQYKEAWKTLSEQTGVLLSKSLTPFEVEQFDVQFFTGTNLHERSPFRFLTKENETGPHFRPLGTVIGASSPRTEVRTSPLSDHISEVCGVPQKWGPPQFNKGFKWTAALQVSSHASIGFDAAAVMYAVNSYWTRLTSNQLFKNYVKEAKPLSQIDTISGQDGVKYIDAIKSKTAVGFPLTGPKSNVMVDAVSEKHRCPKDIEPRFWDELERLRNAYRRGERTTQIFKACFKDEAVKLDKDKVRIFQASPIALALGVRMYFLPILRLFSVFPLVSECAVGINSEGPEWDQLHRYITKFGDERILAGDYSKYDLRMPSQLVLASFRILIDLAKLSPHYTADDIVVMEGLASEIAYAYVAFNGDLYQSLSGNPSGNSATVFINSMVNSLLCRIALYYVILKEKGVKVPDFNKFVNLITYGDDFCGSVSSEYPEFNHISMAAILAESNIILTMPDKTATPTPYMTIESVDFLKRKSRFNAELGQFVGVLEEDSIFKSLHCQMKSKDLTLQNIAAQNIDGALNSWFYHGKEVFEMRRVQMKEVAERADIDHMVRTLNVDYETRVMDWKAVHAPTDTPGDSDSVAQL